MKTRAAVIYAPHESIRVEEIELDPPKAHEVQVRMVAAGICHSDYHVVNGELPGYLPMALGHEGAGIVEAVGPEVTVCKPGDHVVLSFTPSCGVCTYCRSGRANLCVVGNVSMRGPLLDGTFRMHDEQGKDVGQMCLVSTFSERTVVPDISLVVVGQDYPLNRAVLVSCGVPTGVGAVTQRAKVQPGSSVMVIGCGGIGFNAIQGAVLASASTIIAVDVVDNKLDKARGFGATHTINAKSVDMVKTVREMTERQGVDYAFQTIATPSAIEQAYKCLAKGGTLVIIGLADAKLTSLPVSPLDLVVTQRSVLGAYYGGSRPHDDIRELLALYGDGKLKLDELVTRTYTLDQINDAYADMLAGRNIRGVIEFSA